MRDVGEVMMITWAGMGVKIEQEKETQESLEICISVPEFSYFHNVNGEEMSGKSLARRYKEVLTETGIKRLFVKWRMRSGERWTKEMSEKAQLDMKRMMYGSQY